MVDTTLDNWIMAIGSEYVHDETEVLEWGPEIVRPAHLVDATPPPPPYMVAPEISRAVAARGYRVLRPGLPITLIPTDPADPNLVECDTEDDLAEWMRTTVPPL